jgi:hypothetical protein
MKFNVGDKVVNHGLCYVVKAQHAQYRNSVVCTRVGDLRSRDYTFGESDLYTEEEWAVESQAAEAAFKDAAEKLDAALMSLKAAGKYSKIVPDGLGELQEVATLIGEECGIEWNSSNC